MMIDIDYFKLYNDDYGHVAGEEVLKKVASALTASMRRQTDFTARYDDDKFVVLATDMTMQQTYDQGNTLCANVRNLNIPHKGSPNGLITVSCGIAHVNQISSSNLSLLLLQADKAFICPKQTVVTKRLNMTIYVMNKR